MLLIGTCRFLTFLTYLNTNLYFILSSTFFEIKNVDFFLIICLIKIIIIFHLIYLVYDYNDKMMNNVFESFQNFVEPCTCKLSVFELILAITVYRIYIACVCKTKTYMMLTMFYIHYRILKLFIMNIKIHVKLPIKLIHININTLSYTGTFFDLHFKNNLRSDVFVVLWPSFKNLMYIEVILPIY